MKPKVAVDLDDVLFPFIQTVMWFHNVEYGTRIGYNDVRTLYFHKLWGCGEEETQRRIREYHGSDYFLNNQYLNDARELVSMIKEYFNPVIVTSRSEEDRFETERWIDHNFKRAFSEIHFVPYWHGKRIEKSEVCLDIGARLLIDDHHGHTHEAFEKGMLAIMPDRPWNQVEDNGVIRVKNLEQFRSALVYAVGSLKS